MARYASILSDVEDPFSPLADNVILDVATAIENGGGTASFCVTGDKCRRLVRHQRDDVIASLLKHDLGLHTDRHSLHPTTMEMLEGLDWNTGTARAMETEGRGTEAFVAAFGKRPSFWGGAGNGWGPQICPAIAALGFPTFVYSFLAGPKSTPVKFAGCTGFPSVFHLSEDELAQDDYSDEKVQSVAKRIVDHPSPFVDLFIGHPTRYRHLAFWDRGHFAGKTPEKPYQPEVRPDKAYNTALRNLERIIEAVRQSVQIVTVTEATALPWSWREPTDAERQQVLAFATQQMENVTAWPVHKPDLDASSMVRCLHDHSATLFVTDGLAD